MEFEFIDWSYISTFAGCLAIVMAITEVIKNIGFIKKIPTQITSWVLAFAILILAKVFTGDISASSAVLALINSVFVSLTANGGYEAITRIFGSAKKDA